MQSSTGSVPCIVTAVIYKLDEKPSRPVYPMTIKKCMSRETTFEGGLVMPGFTVYLPCLHYDPEPIRQLDDD